MALFVALLSFILSANGRNSGEYFPNYNQSNFGWGPYNGGAGFCTLTASYSSGGRSGNWQGCEETSLSYESQQEFDLTYWELLQVCPMLLKIKPEERGTVDYTRGRGKGKYLLPDKLVWSNQCRAGDSLDDNPMGDTFDRDGIDYCPRWQCDNSSLLWDTDYNRSFTYHTVHALKWDSIPLEKTCWKCGCEYWSRGDDWVWSCKDFGSAPSDDPLASTFGNGWPLGTINPVEDPILYQVNKCQKPTPGPTPQPTADTAPPTNRPSTPPSVINYCTSPWDQLTYEPGYILNFATMLAPGAYYWKTAGRLDCSTIEFCKCQDDGTGLCKSSYAEIMSDTELYPGFLEACGDDDQLAECWTPDKAGQLFQWYDYANDAVTSCLYANSRFCPRCGCTTDPFQQSSKTNTTLNTTIYDGVIASNSSSIEYSYDCTECDCKYEVGPRGGVSYMDCSNYSPYDPWNNNEQYPNDLSVDCFYKPRRCYSHSGEYEAHSGYTTCSDQRRSSGEFGNYCSFESITFEDSSAENICIEDLQEEIGDWGCGESWRCDLLGGAGTYSAEYSYQVTQYDCINDKWIGDKYSADMTYSCCNDKWTCNNRTIDEYMDDDTTKSTEMAEWLAFSESCYYSQRNLYDLNPDENIIRAAFCGDRLSYDEYEADAVANEQDSKEMYCTLLKSYWQYYTFCGCNEARWKIKAVSEADPAIKDSDLMIKYWKQDFWNIGHTAPYNLKAMFEFWSCTDYEDDGVTGDTFFTCDFSADVEEINNQNVKTNAAFKILNNWTWIIILISFLFNTKDNRFFSVIFICICINIFMVNGIDYSWEYDGVSGMVSGSHFEKCEFRGDVSTNNWDICEQITYEKSVFQNEDLTWDILVEACPQLEYAGCYTKNKQIDMDKLNWPMESANCVMCPQCPCSNATDTYRHYVKNNYNLNAESTMISRTCYGCACQWNVNAEEYGWNCYEGITQDVPYALNDTEFCPGTLKPTSAPTEPMTLKCVEGGEFGYLDAEEDSMYGPWGVSHCQWQNFTRERYPDYEPAVCVSDSLTPGAGWKRSYNTEGMCLVLQGSKQGAGCYYAEMDFPLREWDCARKKWITDKYRLDWTVYCCNDGHYCNNQTMVRVGDTLEYYSYENVTETVTCKKSNKLKNYLKAHNCHFNSKRGLSDEYWHKMKCKGGKTDSKPTCDDLLKYWKYEKTCDCAFAKFWRDNVNSTYQEYIEDEFEFNADSLARDLIFWNKTLGCGWGRGTKWFCSNSNMKFISVFYVIFVAVSYVFVN